MIDQTAHDQIRDMLGAYALDATENAETARVEAHLATCDDCRGEVDELLEVAGMLGTTDVPPPPHVWEQISAQLGSEPPAVVTTLRAARRERRSARFAPLLIAAAILLLAGIAGLGYMNVRQQGQLNRANDKLATIGSGSPLQAAADRAIAEPGSKQISLKNPAGKAVASVVVQRDGTAYLVPAASLQPLDANRTYQVWGVAGKQAISLAVIGAAPGVTRMQVPDGVDALAVTEEQSPGVIQPTAKPIAQAIVS